MSQVRSREVHLQKMIQSTGRGSETVRTDEQHYNIFRQKSKPVSRLGNSTGSPEAEAEVKTDRIDWELIRIQC